MVVVGPRSPIPRMPISSVLDAVCRGRLIWHQPVGNPQTAAPRPNRCEDDRTLRGVRRLPRIRITPKIVGITVLRHFIDHMGRHGLNGLILGGGFVVT